MREVIFNEIAKQGEGQILEEDTEDRMIQGPLVLEKDQEKIHTEVKSLMEAEGQEEVITLFQREEERERIVEKALTLITQLKAIKKLEKQVLY